MSSAALAEATTTRDIRTLSRLITQIENELDDWQSKLAALYQKAGRSIRIGITGPPGAGKSTIVNAMTHLFLAAGQDVAIVAVDPSSPFTGGALLGDRVRMNEFPTDGSVYFRSMATRGARGGLAAATSNVTVVYDAFGFPITLIETVGVGQVELDIIDACDVVVVVLVPESGDSVQTMKAGLMEVGDIFLINKADRPGAERLAAELKLTLDVRKEKPGGWRPHIIPTEATTRKNVDQVMTGIDEYLTWARSNGEFDRHRKAQIERMILSSVRGRFERDFLDKIGGTESLRQAVESVHSRKADPWGAADTLFATYQR